MTDISSLDTTHSTYEDELIFTVQRYTLHGLSHHNSVCLSVCLSHSCTVHTVRRTIMISSPYGSTIILVSGDITFITKFEGVTPSEGVE